MTRRQIDKLIRDHIKLGPVVSHDTKSNPYWSYVFFLRQGIKWQLLVIDEDIARLASGNKPQEFYRSEIEHALETFKSMPFHQNEERAQ